MPNSIAVRRSGVPAKAAICWAGSIESAPCASAAGVGLVQIARDDAAQDHIHPRDQLARAEGFCDVIVAADLEAKDAVDFVVARGQKQDRHVGGFPDLPADFEPVELGHADVEDDEVRPVGGKAGECLPAVARLGHGHLGLAQRHADDFADMQVVVDGEDAMGHVASPAQPALDGLSGWLSSQRCSRQLRKPQLRHDAMSAACTDSSRLRLQVKRASSPGSVAARLSAGNACGPSS